MTGPLGGHYRIVTDPPDGSGSGASRRRWVTFGSEIAFGGSTVRFYELDESGECVAKAEYPLTGVDITFVHDMAVTENYYVLVLGPLEVCKGRGKGGD